MSCNVFYPPQPIIVSNLPPRQATAFGIAFPQTIPVWSANHFFTGLDWDPDTPLQQGVILPSTLLNATFNSPAILNRGARGVILHVNVTALTGGSTIQPRLEGLDPASGVWGTLFVAPAVINAAGHYIYELSPGAGPASAGPLPTSVRSGGLPRTWRLQLQFAGGGTVTASVGYQTVR